MSRRPNPAADRAEQHRATLKNLVKLEGNKTCSDCKRNKHPRWASWNLGVFICIRCSGIHRGMGTHISKVKSVDLDTWTDEQLQSVLKWGNARANKYWEAKLAPGHVPSEAKIENFIRTKYESKRWTMDGPIPDPSTLEADDDDMPLKKVQEKVQIERSASQRLGVSSNSTRPPPPPQSRPQPAIDLFGDDAPAPQRPSTGPPVGARAAPPKAEAAPPKQTKAGDSLLGLDFLGGGPPTQPARPSSTGPAASSAPSRPDLKQSILSLYASKPAAAPPSQQHARQESFGGLASSQSQTSPQQSSFSGMNDAFSSLSFTQAAQPAPKPSPFSGLDSFTSTKSPPTTSSSNMFGGGGNFFDSKPKAPAYTQAQNPTTSPSSGLSDFSSFSSPAPSKPATSSSGLGDLLDLSMPSAPAPATSAASPPIASPPMNSAFNLSAPAPQAAPVPQAQAAPASVNYGGFSNTDAWGGNDVWGSSAPNQPAAPPATSHIAPKSPGWGAPQVTQDDDFGGWSSAAPTTASHTTTSNTNNNTANKPSGGFGGSDDLFSNVWE
ncbi:putative GTPase activating protein for Arf-domain-containing protein [Ampelomyces quisqualis]|uniref:Putative GTPase activating protein for Arf-domain-containing protein n=1 Tax=Ampelomyces quisqualis TaxID=50730 RepID=A0A6A5QBC7_AMPQU|nr:putative GTPase activating protein for Arf-domain-containing protein [Ampelomyces quisqualis]